MRTSSLTGEELLDAFVAASAYLDRCAAAVDAINVYPVPDGDTGANMSATLREAVARARESDGTTAGVFAGLAKGSLYGARGNSGVILSQALRGLNAGLEHAAVVDGIVLTRMLAEAARLAYKAVTEPVEGTMLTVLREAAEGAKGVESVEAARVLAGALEAAEAAEAGTIDQLPALREAGVTDAGGEGVCVILRGLLAALEDTEPPEPTLAQAPTLSLSDGHTDDAFGYCTEFVVEHDGSVAEADVRAFATERGSSVVVVADEGVVRVHLHSEEPEAVIEGAAQFGKVVRPKIENMDQQHERYTEEGSGAGVSVALLAMSGGPGWDELFRGLGARVAPLGEQLKPSAGAIAAAADACNVPDVIVLPNHANVILAARQAVGLAKATLHLVETRSLAEGAAAAVGFDPKRRAAEAAEAVREATEGVVTVEVTTAGADRSADGVEAKAGQAIALVNGRLVVATEDLVAALLTGLEHASADEAEIVTLYTGAEVGAAERERITEAVEARFGEAEVEVVAGGQPLYPIIAAVE